MKIIFMIICILTVVSGAFSGETVNRQVLFITDLHNPVGMVYDNNKSLFIAEWGSSRVCSYDEQGNRTLITDSIGRPSGLTFDNKGNLYIASYDRNVIYKKAQEGEPEIYATGFSTPAGLLWDTDSLIIANRDAGEVIRIMTDGRKEILSRGHIAWAIKSAARTIQILY